MRQVTSLDLAPVANGGAFFEAPFHYRGTKMLGRALVEAMTFNAIRYRTYFEDARKRAEQVADPVEKQAWLRMAVSLSSPRRRLSKGLAALLSNRHDMG